MHINKRGLTGRVKEKEQYQQFSFYEKSGLIGWIRSPSRDFKKSP